MAGDIKTQEFVTVLPRGAAALATTAEPAGRIVHRYGERVAIGFGTEATSDQSSAAAESAVGLSEIEALGLEAYRRRQAPDFVAAKAARPREGESWNMMGCTQPLSHEAAAMTASAQAAAPTSSYLEGSVAVGIVIVNGPTADLQFTAAERTQVVAEVQNGLSWLASQSPSSGITFSYDIQTPSISTAANPSAADLEAHFRNPAMAALGYSADWNGVLRYVEDIRTRFGTRWTYCVFFTKYPTSWFAYASIGGPRIVMQYANDGWGPDNIDRVFTHETGHIFGAPDEYASSGCTCGGSWGRFGQPNSNCENCAPGGGVACLMKGNTWAMCEVTPAHLGWQTAFPAVRGGPALVQSRFGTKGNFEAVVPAADRGILFSWRNNDLPNLPWARSLRFGDGLGQVDELSMIQSNFGSPGNLELIARTRDRLWFFWRDSGPGFRWNGPFPLFGGARGNPALVQSRFGSKGNFELVWPAAGSGISFAWRNNDAAGLPWSAPTTFGQAAGPVDALTMIQSNFGSPGNLEMIARAGDRLLFFWRDSGPAFRWNGPFPLFGGAGGVPQFIQSRFGSRGNFELVTPAADRGMLFAWRNNDAPSLPWSAPTRFGASLGRVDAVTLIQSNFGSPGNLELLAVASGRLWFFWRDSGPAFNWNGPFAVTTSP